MQTLPSHLGICAAFHRNSPLSPDKIKLKETRHQMWHSQKPFQLPFNLFYEGSLCSITRGWFLLNSLCEKCHLKEKWFLHVRRGRGQKTLNSQVKCRSNFKSECLIMTVLSLCCQYWILTLRWACVQGRLENLHFRTANLRGWFTPAKKQEKVLLCHMTANPQEHLQL